MISKSITLFWIYFLLSILPGCRLHRSSVCEAVSEEEKIKSCIDSLIKYGFKPESVSDDSNKIILPRRIFDIEWKKYKIDSALFDFENFKCIVFDREIFQSENTIICQSMVKDVFSNYWKIEIDGELPYEVHYENNINCSITYDNIGKLWKINYRFYMSKIRVEFSYCDCIDKLPLPETYSMISGNIFTNIMNCLDER